MELQGYKQRIRIEKQISFPSFKILEKKKKLDPESNKESKSFAARKESCYYSEGHFPGLSVPSNADRAAQDSTLTRIARHSFHKVQWWPSSSLTFPRVFL